jgi:hypothetical protein
MLILLQLNFKLCLILWIVFHALVFAETQLFRNLFCFRAMGEPNPKNPIEGASFPSPEHRNRTVSENSRSEKKQEAGQGPRN